MPRKARIDAPGALHHIICRGIEKRNIFRDRTDRNRFLDRLGDVLLKTGTPCYSWALLPNHFHLLLKTGNEPIANVMRRLLTGYAVTFNRRHRRYGKLFQNRYKSILCQEDAYFLELVRYIHLNPLRAGIVENLSELDGYPFTGHKALVGKQNRPWQDTDSVLSLFAKHRRAAKRRYREFVNKGVGQGKNPNLTGGGLLRSVGGWHALRSMYKAKIHVKGDERILGDSDFVKKVLEQASESLEKKYRLTQKGFSIDTIATRVAEIFNIEIEDLMRPGKQPLRVRARSVLAYWAIRELGMTATDVGKKTGLSKSAISRAAARGERIAKEMSLQVEG